jgi:putative phage-type endonuclease
MSYKQFGKLGDIISNIQMVLKDELNSTKLTKSDINNLKKNVSQDLKLKKIKVTKDLVDDIVDRFFVPSYKFSKKLEFKDGDNCFRNYDATYKIDEVNTKIIDVPEEYKKLEEQFQRLYHLPQPEQRTQEWFDYRYNRITASDTATAIDSNPYEPVEEFLYKKCTPDYPFLDNKFVFHGKKYEQIATQLYEHIYNNKVTEFGCLPSEKYKILGASPDGICSKSTLDGKFSDRLGTMLEIKCPFSREIQISGEIAGGICPYYYFCQVQQQLECCDLDKCDFWQCKIVEYKDRNEYLLDTEYKTIFHEGTTGKVININPIWTRGCLLQFLPKKYEPTHDEDKHEYKSTYIYPPRLDMSMEEYDSWVLRTLSSWYTDNPQMAEDYYFDKVLYWKIPKSHNVTIHRDQVWFQSIYPVLLQTWKKVQYYRNNPLELKKVREISAKRKKFYRMNTKFEVTNKRVCYEENKKKTTDSEEFFDCDFVD